MEGQSWMSHQYHLGFYFWWMQAKCAFGSKSFSPCPLPSMLPALVHQSPVLLVATLWLLLVLDMVVANPLFSCTTGKCCKLIPTAQLSLLPSKVYCLLSRSSLALSLMTARAQAFDVSWTPQQLYALETIISSLLLQSGTHTVLPRSSFLKNMCPLLLFSQELYKIMCTLPPPIYPWHFSFTCLILPKMEAKSQLLLSPNPKWTWTRFLVSWWSQLQKW